MSTEREEYQRLGKTPKRNVKKKDQQALGRGGDGVARVDHEGQKKEKKKGGGERKRARVEGIRKRSLSH